MNNTIVMYALGTDGRTKYAVYLPVDFDLQEDANRKHPKRLKAHRMVKSMVGSGYVYQPCSVCVNHKATGTLTTGTGQLVVSPGGDRRESTEERTAAEALRNTTIATKEPPCAVEEFIVKEAIGGDKKTRYEVYIPVDFSIEEDAYRPHPKTLEADRLVKDPSTGSVQKVRYFVAINHIASSNTRLVVNVVRQRQGVVVTTGEE